MTTANGTLTMRCDACQEPVIRELGYICVDLDAVKERERKAAQWNSQNRGGPDGPPIAPVTLRSYPCRVPWRIYHRDCDPDPDGDCYWFHVYRCCTERDVLGWTAHLLEKTWLEHTDWNKFLYRVLHANRWTDTP